MAYSRTRKAPEGARAMFAVLFVSAAVVVAPAGDGNTGEAAVSWLLFSAQPVCKSYEGSTQMELQSASPAEARSDGRVC
jgi:hypothetical protein